MLCACSVRLGGWYFYRTSLPDEEYVDEVVNGLKVLVRPYRFGLDGKFPLRGLRDNFNIAQSSQKDLSLRIVLFISFLVLSQHQTEQNVQEVLKPLSQLQLTGVDAKILIRLDSSGLARTLGNSAFPRSTAARRAFQPLKNNLAPALGARLASTSALDGKIHQVIGAVVDGMSTVPRHYRSLQDSCRT